MLGMDYRNNLCLYYTWSFRKKRISIELLKEILFIFKAYAYMQSLQLKHISIKESGDTVFVICVFRIKTC